jgi:hypothetical protein
MDTSLIEQALPDNYCRCRDHAHDCDKTITNMERPIENWLRTAAI